MPGAFGRAAGICAVVRCGGWADGNTEGGRGGGGTTDGGFDGEAPTSTLRETTTVGAGAIGWFGTVGLFAGGGAGARGASPGEPGGVPPSPSFRPGIELIVDQG